MKDIITKYPNTLREHRLKRNLKQKEVAKELGLGNSDDRISHWERGQALPSIPNLFKLCRIYDTNPKDIYPDL